MRELIPFIPEEEYKSIAKELLGKGVSIIFDGTTRDEEALAMLIRYVHEWEVKMRLMRFQLDRSSVNSDELARIINRSSAPEAGCSAKQPGGAISSQPSPTVQVVQLWAPSMSPACVYIFP